ncbi:hypothetical protein ACFL5Z_13420 [Planctomycetota bacterium]
MAKSVKTKKRSASSTPRGGSSSATKQGTIATSERALSGWPVIIGWAAMIVFALHACSHMVAAGDTWVAMACGRHFVQHGVDTVEPFSANSHKPGPTPEEIKTWPDWARGIADKVGLRTVKALHPTGWVNQNWLTHVIFYSLIPKSSYVDGVSFPSNALVYWKFTIYILSVICVYYTGRLIGVNPVLCAIFASFALFIGRSYIDIRPAGFSNFLVAVFMLFLVLATYRNILYIWLIVPLTVFWSNVHGGYIYVFIMLMPFVGLNLLTAFSKKTFNSIGLRGVCHTIAVGFVTFIAAVVFNPFHLTNLTHTFIISLSEHAERWRDIHEWKGAFHWTNRVGTGFPFLVLYILSIGLFVLWLLSRFMIPRLLKAPKNEIETQKKVFTIQSKIFGIATTLLVSWVVFVSFSFLGLNAVSFLFCAIFAGILLLSVYQNILYIYMAIPLTLLAVWTGDSLAGHGGRYIYPFILLPAYVILYIVASLLSKTVKDKYEPLHIVFVASSAVISLFLMAAIFNPFDSETIWSAGRFFPLKRIWRPIYERNVSLSYASLFHMLYTVNAFAVFVWLGLPHLRKLFNEAVKETKEQPTEESYQLPKIDLAIIAIAGLTIYMAVRSRRFIPIAGIAACPIVAMLIEQIVHAVSASRNFHARKHLTVPAMPRTLQLFFTVTGVVVLLFLGTGWGLKFKRVYLDAWPADPKFSSVFMRMTASDAKPFYALKFIKDNHLEGKMFNYWTEGGFIAWGQEPDPETGKTPLQLFMDGRAQAAYNRDAFDLWSHIMAGGRVTYEIVEGSRARKQPITAADYTRIGQWMDEQLRAYNVWVVLMPSAVFDDPDKQSKYYAIKGLEHHPSWPLVFQNRRQRVYVDIRTPRGKELYDGIFDGSTIYPDDYHANLIRARTCLFYRHERAEKKRGLDFAMKAFELNPSAAPMMEILAFGANFPELSAEVNTFCQAYFDKYIENQDQWAKQDGHRLRVDAARLVCFHLKRLARTRKDLELESFYLTQENKCIEEMIRMVQSQRW